MDVQVILAPPEVGEYRIKSALTTFQAGIPYRFVVRSAGKKVHEFLIMPRGESDTRKALLAVEEEDLRPNNVVTRNLTFSQTGDYEVACRVGRHYEKGMVLPISVS